MCENRYVLGVHINLMSLSISWRWKVDTTILKEENRGLTLDLGNSIFTQKKVSVQR